MAEIIVLTERAKNVLQKLVFRRIDELDVSGRYDNDELNVLHKVYSDIVSKDF